MKYTLLIFLSVTTILSIVYLIQLALDNLLSDNKHKEIYHIVGLILALIMHSRAMIALALQGWPPATGTVEMLILILLIPLFLISTSRLSASPTFTVKAGSYLSCTYIACCIVLSAEVATNPTG